VKTSSTIAAELDEAFVSGKPPAELYSLIRELRAAIDETVVVETFGGKSFSAYQNQYYANNLRQ
jgi:hypothetical protein